MSDPIPCQLPAFDEERQHEFLAYLAQTGTLAKACQHVGVSYYSVKRRMEQDEEFRITVEYHVQLADDEIALEARRRALQGTPEQVIHQGQPQWAPRRDPEGREVRRPVLDPHTGEPVLDPGTHRPLTEPVLEPVMVTKKSDKLLERLLAADPRFSPAQRHRHDHRHQLTAKVGVMVIPAAPEDWAAQLQAQQLPEHAATLLPDGSHRNAHVIHDTEGDTAEEDTFGGLTLDFLEG
jgi:hypothetical protein